MLRITRLAGDPAEPCLRVEGRLVGEWVQVLEAEVSGVGERGKLALDLAGVDFADERALRLLQELVQHGAELRACSPLLLNLLGSGAP